MEKFLKDYIEEITQIYNLKLNTEQQKRLIAKIECNETIWTIFDEQIKEIYKKSIKNVL